MSCLRYAFTPSAASVYSILHLQLSGPSTSVLGAHRAHRVPRLPQPYNLLNRASSPSEASRIRSAMSDSSSITSSSATDRPVPMDGNLSLPRVLSRQLSANGLERQIHPSTRRSGVKSNVAPLPPADRINRDNAGIILISRLCRQDCWPYAGLARDKNIEEALLQANAEASSQQRPTTVGNKSMYNRVSNSISLSQLSGI